MQALQKDITTLQDFESLQAYGLVIARPSRFEDWHDIMRASGRKAMPPQYLSAARYQTALPTSFSVWHKGAMHRVPLLVGGAVPLVNHSMVWLQPGPEMKNNMYRCIKWARAEMAWQKKQAVNGSLRLEVQHGHKPGQRMARLIGFKRISIGQMEIWEFNPQ